MKWIAKRASVASAKADKARQVLAAGASKGYSVDRIESAWNRQRTAQLESKTSQTPEAIRRRRMGEVGALLMETADAVMTK